MKRNLFILIIVFFISMTLADHISFFVGFAISGEIFPYAGVYYNTGDFKVGGSLGLIAKPNDKDSKSLDYIISPSFDVEYLITDNFSIGLNGRMIVVIPYQNEQLYLAGIGGGYSIPLWSGDFNLKLNANFALPISAGERAWSRGKLIPIPFVEAEYELKTTPSDTP